MPIIAAKSQSIMESCGWESGVIVPAKLRERVLETIHEGHIGMVKMKGMSRRYVWWPNIGKEIESTVRNYVGCQEVAKNPAPAPDVGGEVNKRLLQSNSHPPRSFDIKQHVWVRNFRKGPKWVQGTIAERIGLVLYQVKGNDHA